MTLACELGEVVSDSAAGSVEGSCITGNTNDTTDGTVIASATAMVRVEELTMVGSSLPSELSDSEFRFSSDLTMRGSAGAPSSSFASSCSSELCSSCASRPLTGASADSLPGVASIGTAAGTAVSSSSGSWWLMPLVVTGGGTWSTASSGSSWIDSVSRDSLEEVTDMI